MLGNFLGLQWGQYLYFAEKKIWVAGHNGMVGSAIVRQLGGRKSTILKSERSLDLRDQAATRNWIQKEKPEVVIVAAARVGGILANDSRPAEFIYDNIQIAANIIHACAEAGTDKLLFLGSSCVYPKNSHQPMAETELLTGPLEPTNEWYAIAKIAGIKLCQAYRKQYGCDFISVMPTNLYGPNDNYDLQGSHVLPALIRKMHEAKMAQRETVEIWGSGKPKREFLHVDDLADACLFLLAEYSDEMPINVGSGDEVTITELAQIIAEVVGFEGRLVFDASKPDGTPRKLLDTSRLTDMGWKPKIKLVDGIKATYNEFSSRSKKDSNDRYSLHL
jgi:GDP-L-fucose synthase